MTSKPAREGWTYVNQYAIKKGQWRIAKVFCYGEPRYMLTHDDGRMMWFDTANEAKDATA